MQIDSDVPLPRDCFAPSIVANPMPETFTIKQAMALLNCGHSSLYKLVNQGELTIIKILGKSLIVGLREFIERKTAEARKVQAN